MTVVQWILTKQEVNNEPTMGFEYAKMKYWNEPRITRGLMTMPFCYADNNKWYGLVMAVGRDKLELSGMTVRWML